MAEAHVRAWQTAYRGIVPDEYLDGLEVAERTQRWEAVLRGDVVVKGVPRPNDHVVEVDRKVVGFANVGRFRDEPGDGTVGELWAMYVHPDHWGSGAGAELMRQTIADFESAGFSRACLWVLAGNERAQRFYRKHGWSDDGVSQSLQIGGTTIIEVRFSRTVSGQARPR